jgi:glucose-6-phosphate isomerase
MINQTFEYIKESIETLDIFTVLNDDITSIKAVADKFVCCEKVLIIGTGGSSLGGKCLVNFDAMYYGRIPKITFLENTDSRHFMNVIASCDKSKTGVIVISKSGRTTESLMLFATLIKIWKDFDFRNNAIAITEKSDTSQLMSLATMIGMDVLEHNPNIGGRFSVFSIVGILPALIEGVDVARLIRGAKSVINAVSNARQPTDCPMFIDICNMYDTIKDGRVRIHVLLVYSDFLEYYCKWFIQLIAESIGKSEQFGITPLGAIGTIDQHSMLQLFLGGPSDKIFTVVTQKYNQETPKIVDVQLGGLEYHNINDLMLAHQKATITALKKKAWVREIAFEEINIEVVGYLMMLSFIEALTIAKLANINPFDQPAVEFAKKLVFEALS